MYDLSQDYAELHQMLLAGHKPVAFVDKKWDNSEVVHADVCQVIREGEYRIHIFARGTQYGAIYPFDEKHGQEIDLFVKTCEVLNLRWIKPYLVEASEKPCENNPTS
ncbi:MAG: hypothetical protein ACTS9Y_01345 [Methylophilus sp.]|uniref:hypothetical protein n=1 Tax=Methylophilus sp. TaxID=29541 RepID=UPI003FA01048